MQTNLAMHLFNRINEQRKPIRENNRTRPSPSVSWYIDLDRDPSQWVGHMLGSSHIEQMYSDLGSDWRKALRKKGEWTTTCWESGWDSMKGAVRWWLGYGADLDQRPREQPSRQTLQMQLACRTAHVHRLMVHGSNGGVERFTELEFHM